MTCGQEPKVLRPSGKIKRPDQMAADLATTSRTNNKTTRSLLTRTTTMTNFEEDLNMTKSPPTGMTAMMTFKKVTATNGNPS